MYEEFRELHQYNFELREQVDVKADHINLLKQKENQLNVEKARQEQDRAQMQAVIDDLKVRYHII